MDFSDAWCPGLSDHHIHSGKSEGFDADGHFLTRRAANLSAFVV